MFKIRLIAALFLICTLSACVHTQGTDERRDALPMPDAFIGLWEFGQPAYDIQMSIHADGGITWVQHGIITSSGEYRVLHVSQSGRLVYIALKDRLYETDDPLSSYTLYSVVKLHLETYQYEKEIHRINWVSAGFLDQPAENLWRMSPEEFNKKYKIPVDPKINIFDTCTQEGYYRINSKP